MASFSGCPAEIIDSILENLSSHDLAAVSLMNKRLHAIATPLLYSSVDIRIFRDNPRPIIHLCRSIIQKPELAAHIKSVRLRDGEKAIQKLHRESWRHQDDTPKANPPPPTDDDGMPEFLSSVSPLLAYSRLWVMKLHEGDLNAFVALLLSRLHNLVRFRVGYAVVLPYLEQGAWQRVRPQTKGENQFLGKLFQSAVYDKFDHEMSRFQRLEEISYPGPMDTDPGRNPDLCHPKDLIALLSLPSIRNISGWSLNYSSFPFEWPMNSPPDPARLTSLSLSFVHVEFLAQILERTSALKCLSWEWKYIPDVNPLNAIPAFDPLESRMINLDRFVEALKPVQGTLEDLTIKCTHCTAWDDFDLPGVLAEGSLKGLKDFTNIKRFKAPFIALLPEWDYDDEEDRQIEDSMPPNVEIVTISDEQAPVSYAYNEEDEIKKLQKWISETASERTPRLVEVRFYLIYGSEWVRTGDDEYNDFRQIFKGSNIKYKIIKAEDEEPWENV